MSWLRCWGIIRTGIFCFLCGELYEVLCCYWCVNGAMYNGSWMSIWLNKMYHFPCARSVTTIFSSLRSICIVQQQQHSIQIYKYKNVASPESHPHYADIPYKSSLAVSNLSTVGLVPSSAAGVPPDPPNPPTFSGPKGLLAPPVRGLVSIASALSKVIILAFVLFTSSSGIFSLNGYAIPPAIGLVDVVFVVGISVLPMIVVPSGASDVGLISAPIAFNFAVSFACPSSMTLRERECGRGRE